MKSAREPASNSPKLCAFLEIKSSESCPFTVSQQVILVSTQYTVIELYEVFRFIAYFLPLF